MPQFSLDANDVTRGVTSLGDMLFPTQSAGRIQGQLDGALYNQRAEAARLTGVQADTGQFYLDNRRQLADALSSNPSFLNTPEGRALASALALGGSENPTGMMQSLPGAATFIDPNVFSAPELSNVLVGGGIMSDYGNTPAGFAQDQARQTRRDDMDRAQGELGDILAGQVDLEQTRMSEMGQAERELMRRDPAIQAPLAVPPVDYARVSEALDEQLAAADITLGTEERLWARSRYDEIYAQTRNASVAINQVVQELHEASQNRVGRFNPVRLLPGDQRGSVMDQLPTLGDTLAGETGGPAAPTSATGYGALPALPPDRVPSSVRALANPAQGQTVVSPSTGMRLIFWDGSWREVR